MGFLNFSLTVSPYSNIIQRLISRSTASIFCFFYKKNKYYMNIHNVLLWDSKQKKTNLKRKKNWRLRIVCLGVFSLKNVVMLCWPTLQCMFVCWYLCTSSWVCWFHFYMQRYVKKKIPDRLCIMDITVDNIIHRNMVYRMACVDCHSSLLYYGCMPYCDATHIKLAIVIGLIAFLWF